MWPGFRTKHVEIAAVAVKDPIIPIFTNYFFETGPKNAKLAVANVGSDSDDHGKEQVGSQPFIDHWNHFMILYLNCHFQYAGRVARS